MTTTSGTVQIGDKRSLSNGAGVVNIEERSQLREVLQESDLHETISVTATREGEATGPVERPEDDVDTIQAAIVRHAEFTLCWGEVPRVSSSGGSGTIPSPEDARALHVAAAHSVRDLLLKRWYATEKLHEEVGAKRVYYLSLEFLIGRSLQNAVCNLGLKDAYSEALHRLGCSLEAAVEEEKDAALGNGGLGRLASCFLDSLATLNYPAWGYGIRYRYGMFRQQIANRRQMEVPDYWLHPPATTHPWEIPRPNIKFPVRFYGFVTPFISGNRTRYRWDGGEMVSAMAYDFIIPGYKTRNTATMRLWSCEPYEEFDLQRFNDGEHVSAFEVRSRAESVSSVLYPNDHSEEGRELRLKQEYFFVSASIQDILERFKRSGKKITEVASMVAVQLNDTHPSLAIPEFMRILLDHEGMEWEEAWTLTTSVMSYTNHTILPEALERWPVPMIQRILPRHLDIIYEINHRHLQIVEGRKREERRGGLLALLERTSIIEESTPKMVRMALLATVGSKIINGVAQIHTALVKSHLLPDFAELAPEKFQNKTNGVTPRRWMLVANPSLSSLITKWLGSEDWVRNLGLLQGLREHADNPELQSQWTATKRLNKIRLAALIQSQCGISVDVDALFDIQAKRIHEYKRQFLNILGVIHRFNVIKCSTLSERARIVPRVVIFSGKSAAGYFIAKCTIHLINAVADRVNSDPDVGHLLKVVFLPNYNVSLAEVIIPASDISQHISTAGMEASGTSNMKFVMNGGLIVGTLDGANIEIADAVGREGIFFFGALAHETDSLRHALKFRHVVFDDRLVQVLGTIEAGVFGPPEDFRPLLDSIRDGRDYFLLSHDWSSYLDAQLTVDNLFTRPAEWTRRCINSTSMMGHFSSDRTVSEYARDIWHIKPVPVGGEDPLNKSA